jgi:hypothetical protein
MAPVRIPIGFWSYVVESAGVGKFAVRPDLSLFLSGLLAPQRSGRVPKTGRLYSVVTDQGSSHLDLAGLSLLVRK